MRQLYHAVIAAVKECLTTAQQICLVIFLSLNTLFAVTGMLITVSIWFPILVGIGVVTVAVLGFLQYRKHIPTQRRTQILSTVCTAVAYTMQQPMPYTFDIVTPKEAACHAQLIRDGGADIATIRLLTLEKHPQEMDKRLLQQVFSQRLMHFSHTAGLTASAYSPELPLLTLAEIELIGQEVFLHILYTDNRAAVLYYRKLQEQKKETRKKAVAVNPPQHKSEEGIHHV